MQAEHKVRVYAFGVGAPLVKTQLLVPCPGQIDGDAFILFKFFFHGLCHGNSHFFFGVILKFTTQVFAAVSRVDYNNDGLLFCLHIRCLSILCCFG